MKRTIEMILMMLLIVLVAVFVGSTLMSCSSDDDDSVDNLKIGLSDYNVSDPIWWTEGLTAKVYSPCFYCKINNNPGIESLYVRYKYENSLGNSNNLYLEQISVGDVLDLNHFMAELINPFEGFGYDRNAYVATSGTIRVVGKKGWGWGDNTTFTLQFSDLTFTETSSIESGPRPLPQPYIVNGIVTFKHTDRY